jgi:protein SCO1
MSAGHDLNPRRRWLRGAARSAWAALVTLAAPRAWAVGAEAVKVLRAPLKALPPIALLGMNGQAGRLDAELANEVPLLLNFVFTTCSSSCSVQTALLAQVQRAQAAKGRPLQLASITIDPDNDTPAQLRKFAGHFGITAGWQFYTGRFDDLLQVQRVFDVYRGSKSAHPPVLFLRKSARAPWLRVEGFPAAAEVLGLIDSLPDAVRSNAPA